MKITDAPFMTKNEMCRAKFLAFLIFGGMLVALSGAIIMQSFTEKAFAPGGEFYLGMVYIGIIMVFGGIASCMLGARLGKPRVDRQVKSRVPREYLRKSNMLSTFLLCISILGMIGLWNEVQSLNALDKATYIVKDMEFHKSVSVQDLTMLIQENSTDLVRINLYGYEDRDYTGDALINFSAIMKINDEVLLNQTFYDKARDNANYTNNDDTTYISCASVAWTKIISPFSAGDVFSFNIFVYEGEVVTLNMYHDKAYQIESQKYPDLLAVAYFVATFFGFLGFAFVIMHKYEKLRSYERKRVWTSC